MKISEYKNGNEQDILKLFYNVFKKEMSLEFWNWRFKNNPFLNKPMIHLMWDEDKLIGHYAISPIEMIIEGQVKLTALSMTTMTHPEYGGKGIFSNLAESLYNELKKINFSMVWGFPNLNSHYGFIKNLKWNDIATIPMLCLNISEYKIRNDSVKYFTSNQFKIKHSELLNNQKNNKVSINKTTDYLNWRYLFNPEFEYKILEIENNDSFIVYKVIKSFSDSGKYEIDILECFFRNEINNLTALIDAILLNENREIIKINIWISIFSANHLLFEKLKFKFVQPTTYLSHLSFFENDKVCSDYKNWEIGFGYSDIF